MIPQIITLRRPERLDRLYKELERQNITEFKLWDGVVKEPVHEAIAESHKKIVFWAKEQGLNEVLIMEDDVLFPHPEGFKYFMDNKPEDYDLYLAGVYDGKITNGLTDRFCGLHCYFVHSRYYDKFLSSNTSRRHIDYAQQGRGKFVVCYPFAAIQYDGYSDNAKKVVDYKGLLVGREIYGINGILQ